MPSRLEGTLFFVCRIKLWAVTMLLKKNNSTFNPMINTKLNTENSDFKPPNSILSKGYIEKRLITEMEMKRKKLYLEKSRE